MLRLKKQKGFSKRIWKFWVSPKTYRAIDATVAIVRIIIIIVFVTAIWVMYQNKGN